MDNVPHDAPNFPSVIIEVAKAQAEQLATLTALVQRLTEQVHQHGRAIAVLRAEIESLRHRNRH